MLSYPLAENCQDTEILRVVVRESLSGDLARKLIADILQVYMTVSMQSHCTNEMNSAEELMSDSGPSYSMSMASKKPSSIQENKEAKNEGLDTQSISVSQALRLAD